MRLLDKATVFAYCGGMVITNPATAFFDGNCPEPNEDDSRRGFMIRDHTSIYLFIRNHTWRVPVAAYESESSPAFDAAQRVVKFPFEVTAGEIFIGGMLDEQDNMRKVSVKKGHYTVYWIGYNLDTRWPSDDDMELDSEEYALLVDVERYDVVLVRSQCEGAEIMKGSEYLY